MSDADTRQTIESIPSECDDCGHLLAQTPHQRRVEQFMKLAGQNVPIKVGSPHYDVRKLRAALILEEAVETIHALGFEISDVATPGVMKSTFGDEFVVNCGPIDFMLLPQGNPDLVEIVDGCCDISVVTIGTLSACGVPDALFLQEVDRSNLAKFGPGGYKHPDTGKWIKPPGHKPPRIKELLDGLLT